MLSRRRSCSPIALSPEPFMKEKRHHSCHYPLSGLPSADSPIRVWLECWLVNLDIRYEHIIEDAIMTANPYDESVRALDRVHEIAREYVQALPTRRVGKL